VADPTTAPDQSFFFDQTGRFSGQRRRSYETPPIRNSEKIECSMFIFSLPRHMKLAKDKVSFKIKLAAFQANGWADT
jgi:hypothetical protein